MKDTLPIPRIQSTIGNYIYEIQDRGIPGISTILAGTRQKDIGLIIDQKYFQDTDLPLTFVLRPDRGNNRMFRPAIAIDPSKFDNYPVYMAKADLVRTLCIASQYPDQGFERSFKEIYRDAITLEKIWLTQTDAAQVHMDPRFNDTEELVRAFLNDAQYYTDPSFEQWQNAVAHVSKFNLKGPEQLNIIKYQQDKNAFIYLREMLIDEIHVGSMQYEEDYLDSPEEKRATNAALNLAWKARILLPEMN